MNNSHTRACRYLDNCKKYNCTFAHSIEQIKPLYCAGGFTCEKKDCKAIHPDEEVPSSEVLWEQACEREDKVASFTLFSSKNYYNPEDKNTLIITLDNKDVSKFIQVIKKQFENLDIKIS